jgi:dTDP-4-dehydrorhamnose 3,5-epimerase
MLYVPEHCAHGYQTLEENTEIYYLTSAFYSPSAVRGVRFDDPAFAIQWPLVATVVSEQDLKWPRVKRQEGIT